MYKNKRQAKNKEVMKFALVILSVAYRKWKIPNPTVM